ncbi:MAG: AmmeMemoRadiSam system radical SAM enzyme [Oscillospiraceae bacterium]|nr:AmmeMemoRadiSam system radical SAM enzyme [Oscillospiraceae bacterium]
MEGSRIAEFWVNIDPYSIKCLLCPHFCTIRENQTGKCGVRANRNGTLIAESYGCVTSIALDPIEKKPLYKFHPGMKIVSLGSYGCNFHCPFCQNYNISMEYSGVKIDRFTPELVAEVAVMAVEDKNVGIAYTYNEPLIGYEFIKDCSHEIRKEGLANVLVTNGFINKEPLEELLPFIDALNVDIKGNDVSTYNMVGGTQKVVKNTIEIAAKLCHVEVTTLVIPNENENSVEDIAMWISSIDKTIPYHLSRFFPRYKYSGSEPTPPETMYRLRDIAGKHLENVYIGNF